MVRSFVIILAATVVLVDANKPQYKIYEILKGRDHEHNVDEQYYDPDFARIQSIIHREKDNRRLVRLADDIAKRLQGLSQTKYKYSDSSDEMPQFVDKTRSLIVIPRNELLYRTRTDNVNLLQKLIQSALRTGKNEVEDRTAPPRHRNRYDYDD